MRLLLAMMKHETNTFSPVPTDYGQLRFDGVRRPIFPLDPDARRSAHRLQRRRDDP